MATPPTPWSLRAVATGMVLGATLSLCNIYAGLKIGLTFNLSILAALGGFGLWGVSSRLIGTPRLSIFENNISQTAASAGASIASAGLVAAIPAFIILTGRQLGWLELAGWIFIISLLGVVVASGLRRQMVEEAQLPFPAGIATGETLKELHGGAVSHVRALVIAATVAGWLKLLVSSTGVGRLLLLWPLKSTLAGSARGMSAANLGFGVALSPMLAGVGALVGVRVGLSLLLGAVVAWGVLGPLALECGWAAPGRDQLDASWFGPLSKWLLWPGTALMVCGALTSAVVSIQKTWSALLQRVRGSELTAPKRLGLLAALWAAVTLAQVILFDVPWWIAPLTVVVAFVLAIVAAHISGETGISLVGPMGKLSQLSFGLLSPGSVATNLMAGNVSGGAANQAADLMDDFKAGQMIGASPALQTRAQFFGVFAGAVFGAGAFLLLVPDPAAMLLTDAWPAPSVRTWKTVAELFAQGTKAMPPHSGVAVVVAGLVGVLLVVTEKLTPVKRLVPSAASLGLAFILPAYVSVTICLGALLALLCARRFPEWKERFLIIVAAGLIAGESLTGFLQGVVELLVG